MAHLPCKLGLGEQLVELARLVDAAGHQHGVAVAAPHAVLVFHVQQDVGDDLLQPRSWLDSTFCIVPHSA